jgi:hypothetical protein
LIVFATVPPFSVKVFVVPSFDTTKVNFLTDFLSSYGML